MIPTSQVVKALGALEKVNVWTSQFIVTAKFFVIKRTLEKHFNETDRSTLFIPSPTEFFDRLILDPKMV